MERFDVGVLLGRGGFASVYRALERSTGRSVAIKMIAKRRLAADPQLEGRLRREVAVHASLAHVNVVRLYEYFETWGSAAAAAGATNVDEEDEVYACLVMEYCGGGDLRQVLRRRGRLPEQEAVALLRQLVEGVGYLHSRKVVHRDLKLANILLDGSTVKICDFGVAAYVKEQEERWTLCGTPNYIAPEVVRGTAPHGLPVDMWSIGCVAFALLTGSRAPHAARAAEELSSPRRKKKQDAADEQEREDDAELAARGGDLVSENALDFARLLLRRCPEKRANVDSIRNHAFLGKEGWKEGVFEDWEKQMTANYSQLQRISTRHLSGFRCVRDRQTVAVDSKGVASLECVLGDDLRALLTVAHRGDVRLSILRGQEAERVVLKCRFGELPRRYWPLYLHLGRALELVKSRTPRVVLRFKKGEVIVECALMENGPLPDVRVAWSDGARARYSLKTSRFELHLTDGTKLKWAPEKSNSPWPTDAPPAAYERLRTVQKGVAACLKADARNKKQQQEEALLSRRQQPATTPNGHLEKDLEEIQLAATPAPSPRGKVAAASVITASYSTVVPNHASLSFVSDLTATTNLLFDGGHPNHVHHHHTTPTKHRNHQSQQHRGVVPRVTPNSPEKGMLPDKSSSPSKHEPFEVMLLAAIDVT